MIIQQGNNRLHGHVLPFGELEKQNRIHHHCRKDRYEILNIQNHKQNRNQPCKIQQVHFQIKAPGLFAKCFILTQICMMQAVNTFHLRNTGHIFLCEFPAHASVGNAQHAIQADNKCRKHSYGTNQLNDGEAAHKKQHHDEDKGNIKALHGIAQQHDAVGKTGYGQTADQIIHIIRFYKLPCHFRRDALLHQRDDILSLIAHKSKQDCTGRKADQ